MSDIETRAKRAEKLKRKRNPIARELYENKGAFALKVHDPRKETYKREKVNIRRIDLEEDE